MFRRSILPLGRPLRQPQARLYARTRDLPDFPGHNPLSPKDAVDPRPPWVYRTTGLLMYSIIPFVLIYGVFVFDFGEREHVFMPVRRWAKKQKAAFFELSPAEREMLRADANSQEPSHPSQDELSEESS